MTKSEIFRAAHSLAREIQADENIKFYSKALSRGLKIVWKTYIQIKRAKEAPKHIKKYILTHVIDSNLAIKYSENLIINKCVYDFAVRISKYAYKSWKANGYIQMFFSAQVLNALNS